ncbi:ABC transporter permease [Paenibacillus sp. J2TS4]|uniref:ABC transporter permease n=1 Tax=Paenibacillus sp. J2TS4 TaxID=2807194 RepID=UPI001B27C507|nr:ABC transporter permease [Paenibacillus sp. J2TS4]GIP35697.1 osmoprotectant ABC transporter permease [Paenibacillus sp. J2TS4]
MNESLWEFLIHRLPDIGKAFQEHLIIASTAMLLGCLVAIPVGVGLAGNRIKWINSIVFTVASVLQTVPSLALLALLIPLLGIGTTPAILALFLYSLMPLLRNTYSGFQAVDPDVLEAARGMGYNTTQRLFKIQLPLAFPYIMTGIRVTTVYIINWTTLAALIGAGGLGQLILTGLAVNMKTMVITGALVAVLLALLVDFLFGKLERIVSNRMKVQVAADPG